MFSPPKLSRDGLEKFKAEDMIIAIKDIQKTTQNITVRQNRGQSFNKESERLEGRLFDLLHSWFRHPFRMSRDKVCLMTVNEIKPRDLLRSEARHRCWPFCSQTPTTEDVVRFFAAFPKYMEGRGTHGKPAWSVMKNAQMQLNRLLIFHHEDYNATKRGQVRIDAAIATLLKDGIITRDPVREKQWITCQTIKNLVTTVLIDALNNDTKC
jgi:hypothetical protein